MEKRLVKKSRPVWDTQVSVVALVHWERFPGALYDQMTGPEHITYGALQ